MKQRSIYKPKDKRLRKLRIGDTVYFELNVYNQSKSVLTGIVVRFERKYRIVAVRFSLANDELTNMPIDKLLTWEMLTAEHHQFLLGIKA